MNYIACIVAVCPIRKEASHTSEMVSQMLFGEFAEVLEVQKLFTKVRCLYDDYIGWCQNSQLTETDTPLLPAKKLYSIDFISSITLNTTDLHISMSSPILAIEGKSQLGNFSVDYKNCNTWDSDIVPSAELFKEIAIKYINVPYLWGGRSVFGIDCSGFSQQVYKMLGIHLPRDAYQQAEQGEEVSFLQQGECGDLAFFDNEEGKITHVGILLNSTEIIHASGRVRIDKIDNAGIINSETGQRTHKLRVIKRYTNKNPVLVRTGLYELTVFKSNRALKQSK